MEGKGADLWNPATQACLCVQAGAPRQWEQTKDRVSLQLGAAGVWGNAGVVSDDWTRTGVKDPIASQFIKRLISAASRRPSAAEVRGILEQFGPIEDLQNPFFRLEDFDGHTDTPVEILHTLLLGLIKYVIFKLINQLRAHQRQRESRRRVWPRLMPHASLAR